MTRLGLDGRRWLVTCSGLPSGACGPRARASPARLVRRTEPATVRPAATSTTSLVQDGTTLTRASRYPRFSIRSRSARPRHGTGGTGGTQRHGRCRTLALFALFALFVSTDGAGYPMIEAIMDTLAFGVGGGSQGGTGGLPLGNPLGEGIREGA